MATSLQTLGVTIAITLIFLTPTQSQKCEKQVYENDGVCPVNQISSSGLTWCEARTYHVPQFSFYIKPGHHFHEMKISMIKSDTFLGAIGFGTTNIEITKDHLPSPDRWYKIRVRKQLAGFAGERIQYSLSVNDKNIFSTKPQLFSKVSDCKVMVKGTLFYSEKCNPEDFLQPTLPNTTSRPSKLTEFPQPMLPKTTSSPSKLTKTNNTQTQSWVKYVIIVGILLATLIFISSIIFITKIWRELKATPKQHPKEKDVEGEPTYGTGGDGVHYKKVYYINHLENRTFDQKANFKGEPQTHKDEGRINNSASDLEDHIYESMPNLANCISKYQGDSNEPHIYESIPDLANDINKDQGDYCNEPHIYESMDNLGGPAIYFSHCKG